MTATVTTVPSPSSPTSGPRESSTRPLWRTGVAAGMAAAVTTMAVAAGASAAGVSFETAPGEAIPIIGFGQLTLMCTAIGVLLARAMGGRARQPRSMFTTTTIVLTALSVVPDAVISAGVATKATLMLTHLVAAAIVIPALAARLPERCSR